MNLEDFSHNSANITGFRLVDYDDDKVKETLRQMAGHQVLLHESNLLHSNKPPIIKVGW